MSLDEMYNSPYSEFQILPAENLGSEGDFINYADLVYFRSVKESTYIHVCEDFKSTLRL